MIFVADEGDNTLAHVRSCLHIVAGERQGGEEEELRNVDRVREERTGERKRLSRCSRY